MSGIDAETIETACREVVLESVARNAFGRGLTPQERRWLRDGWVPASLMAEVRDA